MESWLQVAVDCPEAAVAAVEAAFETLGALVTWAEAADAEEILEPAPGATPLWAAVRVTTLLPTATPHNAIRALLPDYPVHFSTVADRDWDGEWRRQLRPLRFGQRLWICPAGQACPDPTGRSVVLDPGLAFGTGTHPTTAMCLRWLDGLELFEQTVLDYGCGSGILAIAAVKLGARSSLAVDIDPQARQATIDNGARNGCAAQIAVAEPVDLLGSAQDDSIDVLVANILAGPLIRLAPVLQTFARSGARVALSGILSDQATEVIAAFSPWVSLAIGNTEGDWVLLDGTVK